MKNRSKRLTVNTLAGNNLKTRKNQYAIMIIGILIAMVFSSGISFFISSVYSTLDAAGKKAFGLQDSIFLNVTEKCMNGAKENKIIEDYGFAHVLGRIESDDSKETSYIAYLDDKAMELYYPNFIEGAYPQNENEIAMERNELARLNIGAKIGDKIKVKLYPQSGYSTLDKYIKKEYTLVGILEDKHKNITYSISDGDSMPLASTFVCKGTKTEIGGKEALCAYITGISTTDTLKVLSPYVSESCGEEQTNYFVGNYKNRHNFDEDSVFSTKTAVFAIILIAVMLIISCMSIINAFMNNLNERKAQIGMFKTLGATKRQVIDIYMREVIFIALTCVPFSMAISYIIVKLVVKLISDSLTFVPNIFVLILSGMLSLICVIIAALIPLVSASRISPVQSIRNIEIARRANKKKIKTEKEFDTARLLAKRNLGFYKEKQIAVSIILVLTILISSYGFSYADFLISKFDSVTPHDYTLRSSSYRGEIEYLSENDNGYSANDRKSLLSLPYVQNVFCTKEAHVLMTIDEYDDYLHLMFGAIDTEKFTKTKKDGTQYADLSSITKDNYKNNLTNQDNEGTEDILLTSYEEAILNQLSEYVTDGEINIDKINSGEEIILYVPPQLNLYIQHLKDNGDYINKSHSSSKNIDEDEIASTTPSFKVGDNFSFTAFTGARYDSQITQKNYSPKIGAIVSGYPKGFESLEFYQNYIVAISTVTSFDRYIPNAKYNSISIDLNAECNDLIDKEMTQTITRLSAPNSDRSFFSEYKFEKDEKTNISTVVLSVIAIVFLFLSISAGLINNSLTAQIREGKRKIGTLRAVGASKADIARSYIIQMLKIFGTSYGAGFALFIATFFIAKAINTGIFEFNFSIWQTALACIILFAICSANLWIRLKQETKNSIIDNIREL